MVTKFGDYFDHIKDMVVNILLIIVFIKYSNYSKNALYAILIITIILFITLSMHLGCQEKWVKKNMPHQESEYLSIITKLLNLGECDDYIHYLKYLGCGSFALWISLVIFFNK